MRSTRAWRLLPLLALLASLASQAAIAQAATVTVCPSGCPYSQIQPAIDAAQGGDTISIAAGSYSGGIAITKNLTLHGAGTGATTITGGGRVVTVNFGVTATLQDLTISGGNTDAGGGIVNSGTLTLANSTVSGNSADLGGGIYNTGMLTLINTTVSGNSATSGAGGIYNDSGTVSLNNSTISGNSATISGGGIYSFGAAVTLSNTLLATNTAGNDPDCHGVLTDGPGGHNLLGNNAGCSGLTNGTNGDQMGTSDSPLDPKLGPLQNNGGPTQTQALLSGSPAIGAGDAATCEALVGPDGVTKDTDQRGFPRRSVLRGACDIGAFDTGGTLVCSQTITQPVAGNLAVTSGTTCVVGTTVGGGVTVAPGAALSLLGARVAGAVQSQGAQGVLLCGSTLGSLTVRQTSGVVLVGGGTDADQGCAGDTIKGKVELGGNQGGVELGGNQGGVELGGNQIRGSVQLTNNAGPSPDPEDAAPEVEGNQIGGSLTCAGNTPAPSENGQANTVAGARSGQCAAAF